MILGQEELRKLSDEAAAHVLSMEGTQSGTRTGWLMITTIFILIYLVFCLLVGLCGSQRRLGFLGTFILSLFITPVVMVIILLLTGPPRGAEWRQHPQGD